SWPILCRGKRLWISATVAASNFKRSPCPNARLLRLSPSVSNSKRAHIRVEMEEIPDQQVGGLSHSSSMMSIESLVRKVSNIYHSLCLIQINLINLACMYSWQENETQSTTSTSLSP